MDIHLYFQCAAKAWAPGFGDRDTYGIVMTFVYLAAAGLAVAVAFKGPFRSRAPRSERVLWVFSASVLVALAVNKQLDLQTMFVAAARCIAQAQGWYETRREYQTEVVVGLVLGAAILVPAIVLAFRRAMTGNFAFVLSLSLLVVFVLLRAISLHHLDIVFGLEFMSLRLHRIIEVVALCTVILSAVRRLQPSVPART